MLFKDFAHYLQQIEGISARNEIVIILAELFKKATSKEIGEICYLVQGHLGPPYKREEFGVSHKLILRSLSLSSSEDESDILLKMKRLGDVGDTAREVLVKSKGKGLSVSDVFSRLLAVAKLEGAGSQDEKIEQLARLMSDVDSLSVKYIARIPVKKLRLGFSEMTILDALSWMVSGDKSYRQELERAFNVSADIGLIAKRVKAKGVTSLSSVTVTVGIPVRPAAAERLPTAEAIIEKLGTVSVEPKIDGFRLQMHFKKGKRPRVYSRNLEDMSDMFPEVIEALLGLSVRSVVLEGEAVAFDPVTDEMLPFQETIKRRRKHKVDEKARELPLKVFCFDVLYFNGRSLLNTAYHERREVLADAIGDSHPVLLITNEEVISDPTELSRFFQKQLLGGFEGIMSKRLDAPYAAGSRNFNWVKLKREDTGSLNDTIDCVVMGYKSGQGKRNKFGIGAFLVGVYDEDSETYKSISNVGTGLTDEQWIKMKKRADTITALEKPKQYDVPSVLEQDVWLEPQMVVEILADTITRSPTHTAGKIGEEQGYALRFPRLVAWCDDKSPEQATSVSEIVTMYKNA